MSTPTLCIGNNVKLLMLDIITSIIPECIDDFSTLRVLDCQFQPSTCQIRKRTCALLFSLHVMLGYIFSDPFISDYLDAYCLF